MARKKNSEVKKPDLIKKIVEWVGEGVGQAEMIQRIKDMGYCIQYAYLLLNEAKPLINEMLKDIGTERLNSTISKLEGLYREANGDRRLQLEIQKEINKISGLHQQKVDITTDGEKINNINIIKIVEVIKNEEDDEV